MTISIENRKEKPSLVALIDRDTSRRGTLRQRLEGLGHPALAFATVADFLEVVPRDLKLQGVMIVLNGDEQENYEMERILALFHLPLLLVTLGEEFEVLNRLKKSFLDSEFFDAIPLNCSDRELEWRLQFLRRRNEFSLSKVRQVEWGIYRFDDIKRMVFFKEEAVKLKPREFDLALTFFRNCGSTLTRDELYAVLWGVRFREVESRTLDVCVHSIRKKLQIGHCNGFLLQSIYGAGYRMKEVDPQKKFF